MVLLIMENHIKLLEDIKIVVNSEHWSNVKKLLNFMIEQKRDSLEMAATFEEVIKVRGFIEALREIKNFDIAIKELDLNTNPQSRGRDFYRPSSIGTVTE